MSIEEDAVYPPEALDAATDGHDEDSGSSWAAVAALAIALAAGAVLIAFLLPIKAI